MPSQPLTEQVILPSHTTVAAYRQCTEGTLHSQGSSPADAQKESAEVEEGAQEKARRARDKLRERREAARRAKSTGKAEGLTAVSAVEQTDVVPSPVVKSERQGGPGAPATREDSDSPVRASAPSPTAQRSMLQALDRSLSPPLPAMPRESEPYGGLAGTAGAMSGGLDSIASTPQAVSVEGSEGEGDRGTRGGTEPPPLSSLRISPPASPAMEVQSSLPPPPPGGSQQQSQRRGPRNALSPLTTASQGSPRCIAFSPKATHVLFREANGAAEG
jgi:hypothetical protein